MFPLILLPLANGEVVDPIEAQELILKDIQRVGKDYAPSSFWRARYNLAVQTGTYEPVEVTTTTTTTTTTETPNAYRPSEDELDEQRRQQGLVRVGGNAYLVPPNALPSPRPIIKSDNGFTELQRQKSRSFDENDADPYALDDGLIYNLHPDDTTGAFDRKWQYSRWLSKTIAAPGTCEEQYKNCWHCTASPQCKYCLLRFKDTGKLVIERGSSNVTDDYVGRCVSVQDPDWARTTIIGYAEETTGRVLPPEFDRPPIGYKEIVAECHVILPDLDSTLTCIHADYTGKYPGFRTQLENMQQSVFRHLGGSHSSVVLPKLPLNVDAQTRSRHAALERWASPTLQQIMHIELPGTSNMTVDSPRELVQLYIVCGFIFVFLVSLLAACLLRMCGGTYGLLCLPCRICGCAAGAVRKVTTTTRTAVDDETPRSVYTTVSTNTAAPRDTNTKIPIRF